MDQAITYYRENPIHSLQVLTLMFGIVDVGITADSFKAWPDEEFFLAMTIIALLFSLAVLVGEKMYVSETTKVIDMTINLVVGTVLGISAIIMFVSALRFEDGLSGYRVAERSFAGILGMSNGMIFASVGVLMLKELQNSIFPIEYKQSKFLVMDWDRIRKTKYLGKMQALAIILGAIDLGLTAHSYYRRTEEGLFLTIVATCFIFSTIELVGTLLGFIKAVELTSFIVFAVAHFVSGLLLVSGGILMIIAVSMKSESARVAAECANNVMCGFGSYDERIVCGVLGIMNGILYGAIGFSWYSRSKKMAVVPQYEWDYEDLEPLVPENSNQNRDT